MAWATGALSFYEIGLSFGVSRDRARDAVAWQAWALGLTHRPGGGPPRGRRDRAARPELVRRLRLAGLIT